MFKAKNPRIWIFLVMVAVFILTATALAETLGGCCMGG
jgi:hypothetical protein